MLKLDQRKGVRVCEGSGCRITGGHLSVEAGGTLPTSDQARVAKTGGAPIMKKQDWEERLDNWARDPANRNRISSAVNARRKLPDGVEAHEDGFWISAMWFRYQQPGTRGLLGTWMDIIEKACAGG